MMPDSFEDNDCIDITSEMDNLRNRLTSDESNLAISARNSLNTLIYHFERFLDTHKKYEETKMNIMKLDAKLKKLGGEHENSSH